MAHLSHKDAFEELKGQVLQGIESHFPVEGRTQKLELKKLEVDDAALHADDIRAQHDAKVQGKTWAAPVHATFEMTNHATGKVTTKRMKVADIPFATKRYGYIVNGQEYQVDNQWQLKPGVYTRRRQSGELETRFNVPNKKSFDVTFDPKTKVFHMDRGSSSKIPVYPLMKVMGVDDDTLERNWGKDVLEANRAVAGNKTALQSFFKSDRKRAPSSLEEAENYLVDTLTQSQLRPDSTKHTIGKGFDAVDGDVFTRATSKMLGVQQGTIPEDDRDNLIFKDLRSVGDYASDKLTNWKAQKSIKNKMLRKINQATDIREIVKVDTFNDPILSTFTKNSSSNPAKQINPVEMVAASMRTTIMGPGGIKSTQAIVDEAKLINPSHMGFLDPLHTPECFDEKTEVFTRSGWVPWREVEHSTELACRIEGRLEFHRPFKLHKSHYDGTMIGSQTQQLDFLVTPDHRMWVRPNDPSCLEWRFETAEESFGKPRRLCAFHRPLKGHDAEYIYLPSVEGNNSSVVVEKVPTEDWTAFMGWFLSEGSCVYDEEKSNYFVKISQNRDANPENCEEIEQLLNRLPWTWCYTQSGDFVIGVKQLAYALHGQGKCHKKFIPEVLLESSEPARHALLDALLKGDGRLQQRHGDKVYAQQVFTTTSPCLAEGFERLALSLGLVCKTARYEDNREERYLSIYEVRIHKHQQPGLYPAKDHFYRERYSGNVYCATVPGGLLLVRRNSSLPCWLGNSDKTGVTLHLPIAVRKQGKTPTMPLYNIKTGKTERVSPETFFGADVVLPDQVEWKNGKPKPIGARVKLSTPGNDIREGDFKDAKYVMRHPSQLFSVTSNLIPFMGNNSGNRASYATSHIEQAISLRDREAPLVQVSTGAQKEGLRTFEEFLGKNTAHVSPINGEVVQVKNDGIIVKGTDGKKREVQIYNNFPLNDPKSVLHSTPTVKVGDKVKKEQVIADTNFTRNGSLALGTNLNIAYLPYKGYNFEDGVVISESAAKKLSSVHMHKPGMTIDKDTTTSAKKFAIQHPESFTKDQYKRLDVDGVVQVGQRVQTGDPLVLGTKPYKLKDRTGVSAIRKNASGAHTDVSLRWESDHPGEVVGVHRNKKGEIQVHVRTVEPMQVGDKISGRYGNKGIVTKIMADKEMPHTTKGEHVEVALNPSGVPGRMNVGQVLETAAAKIAKKTGKTYVVENFAKEEDVLRKIQGELKQHGLSDTEELIDPKTGKSLGRALMGPQHMLKLTHQVDKKLSVRSGMAVPGGQAESYDLNLMPASGGTTGGQSMGNLGMYTMLAHGATANIREMQTWKSEGPDSAPDSKRWQSQHQEVWNAIQTGDPLPPPKSTFAFQKFTDMLRAAGVNVEKKGNHMQLSPLTDKQILGMAERSGGGELPKPTGLTRSELDDNGEPKPFRGGLFDPKLTGGHGGKKWTYFKLAEPMPNPVFEGAIQKVLGITGPKYTSLVESSKAVDPKTGKFVDVGTAGSITGGPAIAHMLGKIDVVKDLKSSKEQLDKIRVTEDIAHGANTQKLDTALKKVKFLQALKDLDISAKDAYTLNYVPVIPPAMRPASVLPSVGKKVKVQWADLNGLYKELASINDQMKHPNMKALPDEFKKDTRAGMYDGLKALVGVGSSYADREDKNKGALLQIAGSSPKNGYFQKTLMSRRQDLSMRSTIIPEPSMGLDEVGLPSDKAMSLFRPFLVKKMVDIGVAEHPLAAQKMLGEKGAKNNKQILKALDLTMEERPVMLKRDPVLHKHGVQAFNARRVPGKAIQIHPLVTSGYNADFDGDAMSAYVPISDEAVEETRKMFPSNNLFNEATGRVTNVPTLESALGLYKLSRMKGKGTRRFASGADTLKAVEAGKLAIDETVQVKGIGKTTAGRVLLSAALPVSMQKQMLTDPKMKLDKSGLPKLYENLAKNHIGDFAEAANQLKDLGYDAAYGSIRVRNPNRKGPEAIKDAENSKKNIRTLSVGTHTLSLKDFEPDKVTRDRVVNQTQKRVDIINRSNITQSQKDSRAVEEWTKATAQMWTGHNKKIETQEDNLVQMLKAGVKPKKDQYQQMKLAPMLLQDSAGRTIPQPVTKSYAEGLDVAGYWTQMHGARKGSVMKVQEVQEPGYFSKQLINTTMNLQINGDDCKTARGVALNVKSNDIYDRELAADLKVKGQTYKRGMVLTPDLVTKIRSADPRAQIVVRSPLKCEHGTGLCQKCAGLAPNGQHYDKGTNLGILAAQSLGERSMQLTLKAFHSGGVAGTGGKGGVLGQFARVKQLTELPGKIPDAASLSMKSGNISKIRHEKTGSWVTISGQDHFVPLDRGGRRLTESVSGLQKLDGGTKWNSLKVGQKVQAGQSLSDPNRTFVNPHDLYKATKKMDHVQNHLTNELHSIFSTSGVRRQHVETVVKAMGNLTRVIDPGDGDNILKGEFQPRSVMQARNRELVKAGRKPVQHVPILQGIDMMPITVQEDWMAKLNFNRLRESIYDAAATGGYSNLHGTSPVPGMALGSEFGITKKKIQRDPRLKKLPRFSY